MKKSLHKKLMDKAYNKFQDGWSLREFYINIDGLERRAVALGNLNYQVGNGGFTQWMDNGYAEVSMTVLRFISDELDKFRGYKHLKEGLYLAFDANRIGISEDSEEVEREDNELDRLDTKYYSLKRIEGDMEKYLNEVKRLNRIKK